MAPFGLPAVVLFFFLGLLCSGSSSEPWEASSAWNEASRLSFLPCRCRRHHHRHHHRHLHQTHPSSLSLWFVVMCCRLKSPSRNSEYLNQQEFLRLHLHPGKFKIGEIMTRIRDFACSFSKSKLLKHRMLLFQQRTQETKLRHLFDC